MSETEPGADELRVRAILKQRGVGTDPALPDTPTGPPPPGFEPRERDWLDDLLDDLTPEPVEDETADEPEQPPATSTTKAPAKTKKRKKKRKGSRSGPRSAWDTSRPAPRQSLIEAWDGVPYRFKWLAYHASAAYLGWSMGLVDWVTYVTAWIADAGLTDPQSVFWYCAAAAAFLLYRRTRPWPWPLAWLAAVPAASTVTGVLLYGTPHP